MNHPDEMTRTSTSLHYGTLAEFIADRKERALNEEQYEAFAIEFYLNVVQIVSCRANGFSLMAELALPKLNRQAAIMPAFATWSVEYAKWAGRLFSFEREALATVRVAWSHHE